MSSREQGSRGNSTESVKSEDEKKDNARDYGKLSDPNAKVKKQVDNDPDRRNSAKDADRDAANEQLKDAPI